MFFFSSICKSFGDGPNRSLTDDCLRAKHEAGSTWRPVGHQRVAVKMAEWRALQLDLPCDAPAVSTSVTLLSLDSSTATLSKNRPKPSSRLRQHNLLRFRSRNAVATQETWALPCNTMPRQRAPIKEDYTKWSPYRCMILYGLSTPGDRLSGIV
ncbi:hypothetical protein HBI56_008160 [Parastagonospora nodorum]|uniref:Uncharacterized protein n=1 Tax=Phaeosphaeria nodorum (strain SN15 / ATCC MYA-4574 / FGSC 10173) TaxID=321614 RepID=A0A7U2HW98_PHANO|nr:hypothetical protein HBH56_121560 [Parastagonospora nodorum]QRC90991.1 hypothetical protein JI435_426250 [Parastagonospora nodorum SN15]KAH3935022.1 hypothetical protein HBH54_047110 [Parastagonospora nodorum]KAH3949995.1 hypothetical protein HBH53_076870 [Parastagonospora nodorum]KAH3986882.1 hypothetical protein HBH51_009940 [Parastagonospora nodorum]